MRFQLLDIIPYRADPLTGRQSSPADRLEETLRAVVRAEELGFDAVAIDQLSRGRLELTIGKRDEAARFPLFGLEIDDQWELRGSRAPAVVAA